MTIIKAHYDGKVLVPDSEVHLPLNQSLEIHVFEPVDQNGTSAVLTDLVQIAKENPINAPPDFAEQHDHYLYGTPKK